MASTACRDFEQFPDADRSLFLDTIRALAARGHRATAHLKKLVHRDTRKFERHYPGFSEFWTTRAGREIRVLLTPTTKGWKVLGFARKGGVLYASER